MKEIICPYCHTKIGELEDDIKYAQGSVRCVCKRGFGFYISEKGEMKYRW